MSRRSLVSLVLIVAGAVGLLAASLAVGNSPLLGLDLKGGVEVVLVPVDDPERSETVTPDDLDTAVNIIRNRIDGLGVAEPDVTRQGNRVVVQLPGISDQQRAIDIVGQTAELRFRPVCTELAAEPLTLEVDDEVDDVAISDTNDDLATDDPVADEETVGDPASDGVDTEDDVDDETVDDAVGDPVADGVDTEDASVSPVPPVLPPAELDERGLAACPIDLENIFALPSSTAAQDQADSFVVLPERNDDGEVVRRYLLGPANLTGAGLSGADSAFTNEYVVIANFKGGDEGSDKFDELAFECFSATSFCPSGAAGPGRVAIVVDGTVEVAPTVNAASFSGEAVISGNYSGDEAEDLALVLRYGALPVEFQDPTDPQSDSTSRGVSATIGSDSLRAGVIAGIVGLALVFLYMVVMYRFLGVIAMLSLGVSATWLWVIVAWLGETQDLALTLAGVTGLIVAIGVSLDSNVVYFEHLKEDVATGRSLRSSLEQSFKVAFITIFRANFASLIAAVILYWLSAGSVRGFALMLGLASVLDLLATYFFLRPCAQLLARSSSLMAHPHLLGLPTAEEAMAPASQKL
ncbi:MAG: protein translocase subunit SecD [Acidimicrobiia bacterium]|nr:protein translocase subunit SecD [Acidimicrobiia bacterium]